MRVGITATLAAAGGLVAAGMLGVATAEAPTTATPPRTVSVQGVASEAIDQSASAGTAQGVYRQGMADAIADGLGKAQFLAGKVATPLGAVQSLVEQGGYISCPGEAEYLGAQPDFGSAAAPARATAPAPEVARPPTQRRSRARRRRHHATPVAKAGGVTCTLYTQVSLAYLLG
jgi:hypothetical protein